MFYARGIWFGPLAQLAEQGTLNPKVEGSKPSRPMLFYRGRVAKLADAMALGAIGETLGGSNPLPPIFEIYSSTGPKSFAGDKNVKGRTQIWFFP